jgi:hypothetical protein
VEKKMATPLTTLDHFFTPFGGKVGASSLETNLILKISVNFFSNFSLGFFLLL